MRELLLLPSYISGLTDGTIFMKYKILRALDVAGLKVFEPIVRLVCGEEPMVQLKKIGLFICIPVVTFAVFLGLWSYAGPRHKTKSGEVPGPRTVAKAWKGIVLFADRESVKAADFKRSGANRDETLEAVQQELAAVEEYSRQSNDRFKKLEQKRDEALDEALGKYVRAMALQEQEYAAAKKSREQQLIAKAEAIPEGDVDQKTGYLALIHEHLEQTREESDHLKAMRAEIDERRNEKWSVLEEERKRKTSLDEAKQFLKKRENYLSSGNRAAKVAAIEQSIEQDKRAYLAATGPDVYQLGLKIVKADERLKKTANSSYAQPPTFFMQVRTSLACVFCGFLIATAIAIPVGVLCGLSDVFMSAMTPLISLFKPVSPIVWLPIVFIIIGGFQLPQVEGYWAWLFTPSFLASAVTVALCSLWPTLVNTALGVASIDKDHVNVARVLRLGFWSRLFKIVIPSALPLIFTGLRISLGVGWMVLIAAELLSSSPGLGKYVWDMFNNGSSETFAQMFVVVFVVGVVGMLLDRMMIVFQRLVSFDGAPTAL